MELVRQRIAIAEKALSALQSILRHKKVTDIYRDAAIQRFEFTYEATWKAAQIYLDRAEGIHQTSPRSVVRACLQVGVLSDSQAEVAFMAIEDRNLSVHTYNENLALALYARLSDYESLFAAWLSTMQKHISQE
jgi:nucleotidyltransferase substrate binding protein (TIGR01987 family)